MKFLLLASIFAAAVCYPKTSHCYYEGGDAVLQARALYGTLAQPLQLDDTLICNGGGEERSQIKTWKTTDFSVKVVPNPAKDRFSIQATGVAADAFMQLQVVDLNGKIVKDTRIHNGEVLTYAFAPGYTSVAYWRKAPRLRP